MAAAVRIGDPTIDGGVIVGPGVLNVLIGGIPAAVMGDAHASQIPVPVHIFLKGSSTVLIGGKPALRITDACVCGALPLVGCPTVIIGG